MPAVAATSVAGVHALLSPRAQAGINATQLPQLPWRGADLSFLPQMESAGAIYRRNGVPQDCIQLLRAQGCNQVRLRLWVNPVEGWCNLQRTIQMARRAKLAGLNVLLDIHYSDTWADPGQQTKPATWTSLNFASLTQQVSTYTRDVLIAMGSAGALPNAVQLGNEITDGMLWPSGRISNTTQGGWTNFTTLLSAARQGVDDACSPSRRPKVVIHIDRGADFAASSWFFDNLASRNVRWDVTALSYYPWWHGSLEQCRATVHGLATRYNKPVFIAETAYPWTLGWNDNTNNLVGLPQQLLAGFPATPAGQASYLRALCAIMHETPNNLGLGINWWAPDWISTPLGSAWENLAWFDFAGNVLPAAAAIATPAN